MIEILVAVITGLSIVSAALVERSRRENKRDHAYVADKLDYMGKTLGISIDRVEKSSLRTEEKLDQHINDHAKGNFD